ncbi:MAG: amidase [bacterium]|nr:amidase [bacterium]
MGRLDDYESYDALGLAELVAKKQVSPSDLLDTAVSRVEKLNPELNAVVIPMYTEARKSIEAGLPKGPFSGVPFLLKDLHAFYTGTRTTFGSRIFEDFVPDHDSELVTRYRKAGLVIFGKSASPEFGLTTSTESRIFGQTRNPWKITHTSGGSSGGASSAVAAGMLPAANASDGGGSIRIPASCCGLFGLKPSRGRNPFGPDAGEGWSGMSSVHAVTRSVRDSAALLDVISAPELGAPYCAPPQKRPYLKEAATEPRRLRIALITESFNGAETHADCKSAAENAARLCEELGHDVEAASLQIDSETLGTATRAIIASNLRASLDARAEELGRELREDDVETLTYAMAQSVDQTTGADYARSVRVIHAVGRQVSNFLVDYDLILTPTMATPPLELGRLSLSHPQIFEMIADLNKTVGYTSLFNASGHPAMSVPLAWNAENLPIGVQFAGRFGDEATLFQLAAQLETVQPWFERTPRA